MVVLYLALYTTQYMGFWCHRPYAGEIQYSLRHTCKLVYMIHILFAART